MKPVPLTQADIGRAPDELRPSAKNCRDCRYCQYEGVFQNGVPILGAGKWHTDVCARWRRDLDGKPEMHCWFERYDGIGRCGSDARYFEAKR